MKILIKYIFWKIRSLNLKRLSLIYKILQNKFNKKLLMRYLHSSIVFFKI